MTRIEAGWPPGDSLAPIRVPEPAYILSAAEKDKVMELIRKPEVPELLYKAYDFRSMGDFDIEMLRLFFLKAYRYQVRRVPFKAIIIQCVRQAWDFNTEFT